MKPRQEQIIPSEIVRAAITDVMKLNFLGSCNKKTNETGDLNGYYINLGRKVLRNYANGKVLPDDIFLFLTAASVFHVGAGNCGELTAALHVKLFSLSELTTLQKDAINSLQYAAKDDHGYNSYLKIESKIYYIWDGKEFDEARFYKYSGTSKKNHEVFVKSKKYVNLPTEKFTNTLNLFVQQFAQKFEDELLNDRKIGRLYPTLD